jgi:DNA-nicking Smr family endonuclease
MSPDDKPRRRKLSEDERALWSVLIRSIKPLKKKPARHTEKDEAPPPSATSVAALKRPPPSRPQPSPRAAPLPKAAPTTAPPLTPFDRRSKQRLARGTDPIDDRIDLHGRTQSEAHDALLRFLCNAQNAGAKTVLVITGKGETRVQDRPGERGVLKRQVPLWLALPEFRAYVVGFEQAHVGHGGQGALYVRLRRARS